MILDDPLHGRTQVDDPVLVELLGAPTIERLGGVHQAGAVWLVDPRHDVTRLEHSVGAMLLVRRLGGALDEQVAALVHDVGHGAFSHVIDRVFEDPGDGWHEVHGTAWALGTELPAILERHGLDPGYLLTPHRWPLLDQPAPDLCADRIDYALRDSLRQGLATAHEAHAFLDALVVAGGGIAVTDAATAIWFAELFATLVSDVFMDPVGVWADAVLADAIRRALADGRIDEDALMGTDDELLAHLHGDPALDQLRPGVLVAEDPDDADVVANPKPRIVDPLVKRDGTLTRASDIEPRLAAIADDIRRRSAAGIHVRAIARPHGRDTSPTG